MSNNILFAVKQVLVYLIPIIIILSILDIMVSSGLKKTGYGLNTEWNEVIENKVDADILFMGSSRSVVHFSPTIFDSILNLKSYNLGINAYNFHLQMKRLELYLSKNEFPEYIIYSLDTHTLEKRNDLFQYQQFLPFILNPYVRNLTMDYDGLSLADYCIPLFRYRLDHDLIRVGIEEYFGLKKYKKTKERGHYSYELEYSANALELLKSTYPNKVIIDDESKLLYSDLIDKSADHGSKFIMVYSPYLKEAQDLTVNADSIKTIYNSISKEKNIPFWDYSSDSLCYNKKYFMDYNHLNNKGMKIFSKRVANRVQEGSKE